MDDPIPLLLSPIGYWLYGVLEIAFREAQPLQKGLYWPPLTRTAATLLQILPAKSKFRIQLTLPQPISGIGVFPP